MSPELEEAIQNATTVTASGGSLDRRKPLAFVLVRRVFLAVLRELPADVTVSEVLEDLGEGQ